MHQKRRFSNRFSETVKTNAVLSQNNAQRILHQERRFSNRFSVTVMTNAVLTENDGKLTMHQNVRDSFARKTSISRDDIAHFLSRICPFLSEIRPFS